MTSSFFAISRHLAWFDLDLRIIQGVPFVHRIPGPSPTAVPIDIDIGENGTELKMWIPCAELTQFSPSLLKDVDIIAIKREEQHCILIRTRSRVLFQEIYNFFVSIADKIHLNGMAPEKAVEETVERWRELLRAQTQMSEEMQLGLFGELWLLRRLCEVHGEKALAAWTGPHRQSHDFRIGNVEFEVKTTRGSTHSHVINGLNQLEPSDNRSLYVLSLRVELAGADAGMTLPEQINVIKDALPGSAGSRFMRVLKEVYGYDVEQEAMYRMRLQLAVPPKLIPVEEFCPKLTRSMLSGVPMMDRISDVHYRANFEGLGFPEGSPEFTSMLTYSSI